MCRVMKIAAAGMSARYGVVVNRSSRPRYVVVMAIVPLISVFVMFLWRLIIFSYLYVSRKSSSSPTMPDTAVAMAAPFIPSFGIR